MGLLLFFVSLLLINFLSLWRYFSVVSYRIEGFSFSLLAKTFAQNDVIAFVSGIHTFWQGLNPYLKETILKSQQSYIAISQPQIFMNPPWAISVLTPLFIWSPYVSIWVWVFISLFLLWVIKKIIIKSVFNGNITLKEEIILFFALISFAPVIMHIWMGQVSIISFFAVVCSLYAYSKGYYRTSGGVLSLSLIKPQLVYLFIPLFFVRIIKDKRYIVIFWFLFIFALLAGLPILRQDRIYIFWIESLNNLVNSNLNIVFSSLFRVYYYIITDKFVTWPVFVIPSLALIIVLFYSIYTPLKLKWDIDLPYIFIISLFFSPYAWIQDYIFLVSIHILGSLYIMKGISNEAKKEILLTIAMANLLVDYILFTAIWSFQLSMIALVYFHCWWKIKNVKNAFQTNVLNDCLKI